MPNVNVTYAEMQAAARQLQAGEQTTRMLQGLTGMGQYLDAAVKAFTDTDTQLAASLKL